MKEKIDYWYFCLYNYFYRDGRPMRTKDGGFVISEIRASLILSLIPYLTTLFLRVVYKCFYDRTAIIFLGNGQYIFFTEGLLLLILFYFFYLKYVPNKRYIDIYQKYKTTPLETQSKTSKIFIGLFLFMVVSIFVLVFYLNGVLSSLLNN